MGLSGSRSAIEFMQDVWPPLHALGLEPSRAEQGARGRSLPIPHVSLIQHPGEVCPPPSTLLTSLSPRRKGVLTCKSTLSLSIARNLERKPLTRPPRPSPPRNAPSTPHQGGRLPCWMVARCSQSRGYLGGDGVMGGAFKQGSSCTGAAGSSPRLHRGRRRGRWRGGSSARAILVNGRECSRRMRGERPRGR